MIKIKKFTNSSLQIWIISIFGVSNVMNFMKKILFFLLLSSSVFGQKLEKNESGSYKMDTIVASGLKKEALYSNALAWINSNNKKSKTEIDDEDKTAGEIFFSGTFPDRILLTLKNSREKTDTCLYFTGKIVIKDESCYITFYDLKFTYVTDSLYLNLSPSNPKKPDPYNSRNFTNLKSMVKDISRSIIDPASIEVNDTSSE